MSQLPIDFARAERDQGIERAVSRADRSTPGWSDLALAYIRLYASQNKGRRFIGRDIVLASRTYGVIQPPNDKAWGGPICRAIKAGVIRKVGTAQDPNRHCNPVPQYEAA